jgi:protein CpxP
MIMKTKLMLIMVMMSTIIFAQKKDHDPGRHAAARSEKMKTALSLNDTQYATIKGIDNKYAAKYSELRKDSSERFKKHDAAKALQAEREKEIQAVLTPEQKTKWAAYKAERIEKRKDKMKKGNEKFEARIKSELSLSDDQLAKVKIANQNFRDKLSALKNRKDADAHDKAELKKIRAEHDATIKGILSDEQFKKWTDLKSETKEHHNRHH